MTYKDDAPSRVVDRIMARLTITPDDCWIFQGSKANGYGKVSWHEDKQPIYGSTHRILYFARHGTIPLGLDLDHLCHDPTECAGGGSCPHRACGNPDHLEPVTRQVNLLRGGGKAAQRAAVTHCPVGHEYTDENTFRDNLKRRNCRECVRARNRAYYHRNVEKRAAYNKQWREKRAAAANQTA